MAGLGNRIETGFRELVRRLKGGQVSGGELALVSSEAMVKAHQAEADQVVLTSLMDGRRLFCVEGRLEAALTRIEGEHDVVLRLPIRDKEGTRHWIRLRLLRSTPSGTWPALRRVRAVAVPDGLEFHFRSDSAPESAEITLEFTLDPTLKVLEFRPFEDLQPLFRELPRVSEMSSYLRACMHHRRSQLQILADLAESLRSARIQDGVDLIRRRRTAIIFQAEALGGLAERLGARRVEMSPTILGAACLAAELEARTMGLEELATLLDEASPYEPDPEVLERFEEILVARMRGLAVDDPSDSPRERALARAAQALTQDSALRILSDLAAQSQASTAASVTLLLHRGLRDSSVLADDSQRALRRLLARRGRPLSSGTMAGLCLFVDAELGLLPWEQMEELVAGSPRPPTTAYTLAAVAGACDLELRGFRVESDQVGPMVALADGLALVQAGETFRSPDEIPAVEGPTTLLVHLPVLDNLQTRDLEVLLQAGRTVHACYRSSLSRHLVWSDRPEPDSPFAGRVLGRLHAARAEDLEGQEGVLTAWADTRGQVHFRHHARFSSVDVTEKPDGRRWTGEIVELPPAGSLPPLLAEMSRHELSALDDPSRLPPGLFELQEALEGLRDEAIDSLHEHPRLLSFVRLGLVSPAIVRNMCDAADRGTRQAILDAARRPDGVREELAVHPALLFMLDLTETAETGLLAAGASLAPAEEAAQLFQALVPRLREHASSPQSTVRWVTARLLGTALGQVLLEDVLAILQELRRDASRGVSSAATASLVALALAPIRPVPPLVEVRPGRVDRHVQRTEEANRLTGQVMDHVRGFLLFPQEKSPGASLLVREEGPMRRPHRPRIENLCQLVAGLNLAMQAEPRASSLEVRPPLAGEEPRRFPAPPAGPAGPWEVSSDDAIMADRTRFSEFFEHLCRVASRSSLEDLEVVRHCSDGEIERFDAAHMQFRSGEMARPPLQGARDDLRAAARRLIQRLALAPTLEEPVVRLLTTQWSRLAPKETR